MTESQDPLIIIDAHQDIAYNWQVYGRDFRRPALKTRAMEGRSREVVTSRGIAANGLPDAILGRVGIVFGTLFVNPISSSFAPANFSYRTAQDAYKMAMAQMDYYHRLADETARIVLIRTQQDLAQVIASWQENTSLADHKLGIVIAMEGADPVIEPKQLEQWMERGLRVLGPAWSATRYAGGTYSPGPLTDLGRELLEVMADYRMILDLSHTTDEGYLEALDRYDGPIIASHSNPRHFVDSVRMLSDNMIIRLAERGGVIGIATFNPFLKRGWTITDKPGSVLFDDYITTIDYICQLTGSSEFVGIGSDIDGGYGAESMPSGLSTVTDLWKVGGKLAERGYLPKDIHNILCGNFLRILRQGLPVS